MPTIAASPLKVMTDHLLAIRRPCERMCGAKQYGLKSPMCQVASASFALSAPPTTLPRSHDGQWLGSLTWRQGQRLALKGNIPDWTEKSCS